MKKQFFLSLLALFTISTYNHICAYQLDPTKSGAGVIFTKGNVSNAFSRTIESFFDERGNLKKDELYLYLGHPSISTGANEIGDFSGKNSAYTTQQGYYREYVRMPIFVRQLMNTREDFLKSGNFKERKIQLTNFMEALLQHGNIQTTVGCLVNGSDSRCPCCKFENEILLPVFIESVQEDGSLISKIYNAKLAAIILLFIDQVKSFNLQEVDNFIQMASAKEIKKGADYTYKIITPGDKFTLLDLRIRSLLALLNYSIEFKNDAAPKIENIHQENAFNLANKLAEKFLREGLVDVSFLINLSEADKREIESLKKDLIKKIQDKTDLIKGVPVTSETTKIEEEIRQAKSQLLSLQVPTEKRITFYHKYLEQFGKHINAIALTLKGEDALSTKKRNDLLKNSETILRLIPQVFVDETKKTSSVNKEEFGNAASKSKQLLLERATTSSQKISTVNTTEFGSTVSDTKAKIARMQELAKEEESKKPSPKKLAPSVAPKPIKSPILILESNISNTSNTESLKELESEIKDIVTASEDISAIDDLIQESPEIILPTEKTETKSDLGYIPAYNPETTLEDRTIQINPEDKRVAANTEKDTSPIDPIIEEENLSKDDQNIATFLTFLEDKKNAFYEDNQDLKSFLSQFSAQYIITMIQTIASNYPEYKKSAILVRTLITLTSCLLKSKNENDIPLIGMLISQKEFAVAKEECAPGSPRKLISYALKLSKGTLKTDLEAFINPLL